MFSELRFARASCQVAARLTTMPSKATTRIGSPSGCGGETSRRDALVRDQAAEDEQREAVRLRGKDLHPSQPERQVTAGRTCDEADHDEGQGQRPRIGEHVGRIREQRQRVDENAGDDLDCHETEDEPERDPQPSRIGMRRNAHVGVACMGVVLRSVTNTFCRLPGPVSLPAL